MSSSCAAWIRTRVLDCLNQTLGVADKVTIDFLRWQICDNAGEQARQVLDFAVRSAHCGEAMTFPKDFRQLGVNTPFVVALMFDDLALDDSIRFDN